MSNQKIRIKDIALMAGVSEGTVDRVLHNRGEVSEKSREVVNRILKEINYSPNILARSLASKKQYTFIIIMPEFESGEYWHSISEGFDVAANEFKQYHVNIQKRFFNQYDSDSFTALSNEIIQQCPDAVCIAPIFKEATIAFTQKLNEKKIPFSFIDSMIEDTGFLSYYGQRSFQSGYVAAKILFESLESDAEVIIIRTKRKGAASNQTDKRHKGFMQFVIDNNLNDSVKLINFELKTDDEEKNISTLQDIFTQNKNIKAAITFNSKVYKFAHYLEKIEKEDLYVIGYDLLEKNVKLLKGGIVSTLIAQRPEKQAYNSIRNLCRSLIFNQEIISINYVPIDILIKENIDYYLYYQE